MTHLNLSLILFFVAVSQATLNGAPTCEENDRSSSYLDSALDMLTKTKLHFHPCPTAPRPMDCAEMLKNGYNESGVYTIWPRNRVNENKQLEVYCDMETDGGGWTVLQRRVNFSRPNDYFFKDWESYKIGFGDIEKDFWLGNDNIFALTNQQLYSIRFDLTDVKGEKRYAIYDKFWIEDEERKYTLHIKDYRGNAGDSMTNHNSRPSLRFIPSITSHDNQMFSTKDQDNDNADHNCADSYKGGWWYNSCHAANLNGLYLRGKHESYADGINWHSWKGYHESLETSEMKIRPKNFKKL
ncbi:techylectin-like protein isoform X1 [Argiope bruennichi]|uniref:techylectin-like protein isoform X1 n=2 Tax=Argiope bruennichi TaxID=94029 RepID=UPI0024951091|nr:techylectin-like protein isoform X1 [Argiope bruennichi]